MPTVDLHMAQAPLYKLLFHAKLLVGNAPDEMALTRLTNKSICCTCCKADMNPSNHGFNAIFRTSLLLMKHISAVLHIVLLFFFLITVVMGGAHHEWLLLSEEKDVWERDIGCCSALSRESATSWWICSGTFSYIELLVKGILQLEGLGMSNVFSSDIEDISNAVSIDSSNVVSEPNVRSLSFIGLTQRIVMQMVYILCMICHWTVSCPKFLAFMIFT